MNIEQMQAELNKTVSDDLEELRAKFKEVAEEGPFGDDITITRGQAMLLYRLVFDRR